MHMLIYFIIPNENKNVASFKDIDYFKRFFSSIFSGEIHFGKKCLRGFKNIQSRLYQMNNIFLRNPIQEKRLKKSNFFKVRI